MEPRHADASPLTVGLVETVRLRPRCDGPHAVAVRVFDDIHIDLASYLAPEFEPGDCVLVGQVHVPVSNELYWAGCEKRQNFVLCPSGRPGPGAHSHRLPPDAEDHVGEVFHSVEVANKCLCQPQSRGPKRLMLVLSQGPLDA